MLKAGLRQMCLCSGTGVRDGEQAGVRGPSGQRSSMIIDQQEAVHHASVSEGNLQQVYILLSRLARQVCHRQLCLCAAVASGNAQFHNNHPGGGNRLD